MAGEFTVDTKSRPAPPGAGQPPNSLSQELYYRRSGVEMARVHQYVLPGGQIGGKGKPDPKALYLDGIRYRLIAGPPESKDRSLLYPRGSIRQRLYVWWRRLKCLVIGR